MPRCFQTWSTMSRGFQECPWIDWRKWVKNGEKALAGVLHDNPELLWRDFFFPSHIQNSDLSTTDGNGIWNRQGLLGNTQHVHIFISQCAHTLCHCEEHQGGVQQMIAYPQIQSERKCFLFCEASWRVLAQRLAAAESLKTLCVRVCVCAWRWYVWVHRKPIETPAGYHWQPLIK